VGHEPKARRKKEKRGTRLLWGEGRKQVISAGKRERMTPLNYGKDADISTWRREKEKSRFAERRRARITMGKKPVALASTALGHLKRGGEKGPARRKG